MTKISYHFWITWKTFENKMKMTWFVVILFGVIFTALQVDAENQGGNGTRHGNRHEEHGCEFRFQTCGNGSHHGGFDRQKDDKDDPKNAANFQRQNSNSTSNLV
jgi:hypothetical protein